LDEKLYEKHGLEFVYINAPLVVVDEDQHGKDRKRVWWEPTEEHPYAGLDASLLHIQQIWKTAPFCGLLAVGQGCGVASLLPMLLPDIEFGVFVYGKALLEEDERMVAHWPCLHLVLESEKTNTLAQRLVTQFPGQIHVAKTAEKILTKSEFNAMGKFFVEQKRSMRENGSGDELVLQTQLHIVEQQAARLMAEHIAANPPKALMAVIQPQEVSGWHGARRRDFGEEGGGAPCPSEFLLKREKRSSAPDGPSRHHPDAEPKVEEIDK
jgi:hypothetical protein